MCMISAQPAACRNQKRPALEPMAHRWTDRIGQETERASRLGLNRACRVSSGPCRRGAMEGREPVTVAELAAGGRRPEAGAMPRRPTTRPAERGAPCSATSPRQQISMWEHELIQ